LKSGGFLRYDVFGLQFLNIQIFVSNLRYGLKGGEFLNLDESSYVTTDGSTETQLDLQLSPKPATSSNCSLLLSLFRFLFINMFL